jgi:hypothetical protein
LVEQVQYISGLYALLAKVAMLYRLRGEGAEMGMKGGKLSVTKEAGAQLRVVRLALESALAISEKEGKGQLFDVDSAEGGACHVGVLDGVVDATALKHFVCGTTEKELSVWAESWTAWLTTLEVAFSGLPRGAPVTFRNALAKQDDQA